MSKDSHCCQPLPGGDFLPGSSADARERGQAEARGNSIAGYVIGLSIVILLSYYIQIYP